MGQTVFTESPELAAKYFSFMARTGNFRAPGYAALPVAAVFLLVIFVKLRRGLRWLSAMHSHPAVQALSRYGTPETVVGDIESELASAAPFRVESTFLTKTWLLQERPLTLDVCRIADIVWLYQTSPHHNVILHDRHGQSLLLHGHTLEKSESLVHELRQRAPWAFVGFDQNRAYSWTHDRGAVIQAALERKSAGGA